MRFPEYFKDGGKPIISFEIFPPKTDKKMEPACHLTCVGASRNELDEILMRISDSSIRNIVALRGDPPQGDKTFIPPSDGYAHANQLVVHIRRLESEKGQVPFGIAVAGYPEKHIEAPSMEIDIANLKRKVEAGGDIIITQLFFDNEFFFNFVERARTAGITVPIIPGLMPILSVKQIKRITSMCGSSIPHELQLELESAADDDEKASEIGIRQCIRQAKDLLSHGVSGIHFYVLNKSTHIRKIIEALRV